ncbi:MAG: adenylate/guanylate cyclase domain-containing protein [Hyphomicrobiaceae bacterium]
MPDKVEHSDEVEETWREFLTIGHVARERQQRLVLSKLPGSPRCKLCHAPFDGLGSPIARFVFSRHQSNMHPLLCNTCETFARRYMGGAEIELAVLFADVRGSTALAEHQNPMQFADQMNRFYKASTDVLVNANGFIDKLVGDEVIGLFVPGFAGKGYVEAAVRAAETLLRVTGHGHQNGPWIPVGVGVHAGTAFMGAVGAAGNKIDITALGDVMNIGARLAAEAKQGEALVTDTTLATARLKLGHREKRQLQLRGRDSPVSVHVLKAG